MGLPSSFDVYDPEDAVANLKGFDKIWYKCKEMPAVPIGALATIYALTRASFAIRRGYSLEANKFFSARVVFQAVTIAALVGGSYMMNGFDGKTRSERRRELEKQRTERWVQQLRGKGMSSRDPPVE
ncbi:hypoxia induced protein conserved region-domain-containing protein [Kockiozyma suomiensis]|uniref:hypoxia induced protein conserved region-domain-containing protein n=1 Tax=Kockiozyma suomiensis TaxID=1337062 RepID=UPI00334376A2